MLGGRFCRQKFQIQRYGRKFIQRVCSNKPEQVHPDGLTRYPGLSSPNAILRTIDWIGKVDYEISISTYNRNICICCLRNYNSRLCRDGSSWL